MVLTADQIHLIEANSNQNVHSASLDFWVSPDKNIIFVDQVLGKHEFITYAVGITKAGKVKSIEILEYRESYGQQVKSESWRKQFEGKTMGSTLKINSDITNISGATLSSVHVTGGVKRILQTYESIKGQI